MGRLAIAGTTQGAADLAVYAQIQYQSLWQALAEDGSIPFEVWYLSEHGVRESLDPEFGKSFAWDLDIRLGSLRLLDVAGAMSGDSGLPPSWRLGLRLPAGSVALASGMAGCGLLAGDHGQVQSSCCLDEGGKQ
jgi:hypothetical protein